VVCTGMTAERDRKIEDYKGWGTSHMSFESGEGCSRTIDCKLHLKVYLGVVRENSDVTTSNLIESILLFVGYRVKYSKV
jgi:hypothetical protein